MNPPRPGPPPGGRGHGAPRSGLRAEGSGQRPDNAEKRAVGPLGGVITLVGKEVKPLVGPTFHEGTNPLILLRRVAFVDTEYALERDGQLALLNWAAEHSLGQDSALVERTARRRERALDALAASGHAVHRVVVEPTWRMAVGLGDHANPYEIGISLHGTYGWPVIPGSTVKGLTAAWALAADKDQGDIRTLFGWPRPGDKAEPADGPSAVAASDDEPCASRGSVCFLDAVPFGKPASIAREVLTPHVQPYYASTREPQDSRTLVSREETPVPPAEYHAPNIVQYLVVAGGSFAIDVYGRKADEVARAAAWCQAACDDLGVGAKTTSGYGYLTVCQNGSGPWQRVSS